MDLAAIRCKGLVRHVVCAGALFSGVSSGLVAQQIVLDHEVALYRPTRVSLHDGVIHFQQKIGLKLGAGIRLVFTPRFDLATAVAYIPGYATLRGAGQRLEVTTGSHLVAASVGARYWVVPEGRQFSWEVHTGVGMVSGGSPAYGRLFEAGALSGSLGMMLRYQIGRIVSLQLKLQQRLYRVYLGGEEPGSSAPFRIAVALRFPFLESVLQRSGVGARATE